MTQATSTFLIQQQAAQGPPGVVAASVASIAALAALADTNFPDGVQAYVAGVGYYLLQHTSTATADGYKVVATASGNGKWLLLLPITIANPALQVTDWYWDPANASGQASDANSGTSVGAPLLTWTGLISKYGTDRPLLPYGQSATVHQLSAQPAAQDPVFAEARVAGGSQFILDCRAAWVNAGAAFPAGALGGGFGYAGAVATAGGTPMTMAAVPGYVVANTLLFNSTRQSYAFVDSVAGGTAKLSQPQTLASLLTPTAVPFPSVDNDWAANDSIQPITLPNVNLKRWGAVGGDLTAGIQPCAAWVIGASVADSSGNGNSEYPLQNHCANTVMSLCLFPGRVHASSDQGRGFGLYLLGCVVRTAMPFFGGGQMAVFGGILNVPSALAGTLEFLNNVIVHGAWGPATGAQIVVSTGGAFSDGPLTVQVAAQVTTGGGVKLWGSFSVVMNANATFLAGAAFATNALLTNGALSFANDAHNNIGTAVTDSGVPYGPFLLTPANLDLYGGLQNLNTGARFWTSTALSATPLTWGQGTWYLDPANASTTASDSNDGKTSGTALLTLAGLISKLGSLRPVFSVAPTFNWLSGYSSATEVVDFQPTSAAGLVSFVGTPVTKVASGQVINGAAVTAKNRSSPANGQLTAPTVSGAAIGNVAAGDLVLNATHASAAWLYKNPSGNQWTVSQPMGRLSTSSFVLSEVNTWAQTDTVTTVTLPKIFVRSLLAVAVYNMEVAAADTNGADLTSSSLIESRFSGNLSAGCNNVFFYNCDITGQTSRRYNAPTVQLWGGQVRSTNGFSGFGAGSQLHFDTIISTGGGGPTYGESMLLFSFYVDNTQLILLGENSMNAADSGGIGGPFFWGNGSMDVAGGADLTLSVGAGAPQTIILAQGGVAGAITLSGSSQQGLIPDQTADPVVWRGPRSITATLLDTAVGSGGFRNASGQICCVALQGSATLRSGSV